MNSLKKRLLFTLLFTIFLGQLNILRISAQEPEGVFRDTVVLGTLDKVTARTAKLTVRVGQSVRLGPLTIKVLKGWASNPDELPDSKVFLEIKEHKSPRETQEIFKGWMFASYPSISALEHSVYDVWVIAVTGRALNTPETSLSKSYIKEADQLEQLIDQWTEKAASPKKKE